MTDDLPFDWPDAALPQTEGLATRRCARHRWDKNVLPTDPPDLIRCARCHHVQDAARVRAGRNARKRGGRYELTLAKALGGEKVGHHGGPEDVRHGMFVVQAKRYATARFPGWMADELAKLPRTSGRVPILVVGEAAGPGRKGRNLVVVDLDDWIALHGDMPK